MGKTTSRNISCKYVLPIKIFSSAEEDFNVGSEQVCDCRDQKEFLHSVAQLPSTKDLISTVMKASSEKH